MAKRPRVRNWILLLCLFCYEWYVYMHSLCQVYIQLYRDSIFLLKQPCFKSFSWHRGTGKHSIGTCRMYTQESQDGAAQGPSLETRTHSNRRVLKNVPGNLDRRRQEKQKRKLWKQELIYGLSGRAAREQLFLEQNPHLCSVTKGPLCGTRGFRCYRPAISAIP